MIKSLIIPNHVSYEIIQAAEVATGYNLKQLRIPHGKGLKPLSVQVTIYLLNKRARMRPSSIGRLLKRSPTTTTSAIERVQGFIDVKDEKTLELIAKFETFLDK